MSERGYIKRVDLWQRTEEQLARLRRAALECGCTEADGKAELHKRKKPYVSMSRSDYLKSLGRRRKH